MLCFELLGNVLQDAYLAIPAVSDEARRLQIYVQKEYLCDKYKHLEDSNTHISYEDPATRFAYLYRYAGVRADFIYQITLRYEAIRDLLSRQQVRVACIGGGPGTELIGLAKYAVERGRCAAISALILDKVKVWRETWDLVCRHLKPCVSGCTTITADYVEVDACRTQSLPASLADADLFILSYVASEFRNRQVEAEPFMRTLLRLAKPGALFIVLDIGRWEERTWLNRIFEELPLLGSTQDREKLTLSQAESDRVTDFFPKLPPSWGPKTDPWTLHRVYRKPSHADLDEWDDFEL